MYTPNKNLVLVLIVQDRIVLLVKELYVVFSFR